MALISFGYRIDMFAIDPPTELGSYIVAYDLDGVLKQKDHLGVVTLVGAGAGGPQGPPGPVGPAGLTWSGYWVATQSYSENYAVGYGSASWWCISAVTGSSSNPSPDVDTTHWTLLAAQGSPGSQGGTGSPGLQGPQGPLGINWIGDWIINVYDVRDAVYYNGSSYVCIVSTVGTETLSPDTNIACWKPLALKGDTGPQGATGSPGVSGATGSTLQDIFYNIGGTVSATNSITGIYRTGSLNIGTGTATDGRFVVSSNGGTVSFVIDNNGNVYNRSKGVSNTIFGYQALIANTSGYNNTAIGNQSLLRNTYGIFNTALGASSLRDNTGDYNTAVGVLALVNNTLGEYNTAVGAYALNDNTIGNFNTAIGYTSLTNNTTVVNTLGTLSSGSGYNPGTWSNVQLIYSTGSTANVYPSATIVVGASGSVTSVTLTNSGSGFSDTTTILTAATSSIGNGTGFTIGISTLSTGRQNTAIGHQSLRDNTIGTENVAIGFNSLFSNVSGSRNNALGRNTLYYNSTGDNNTAIGYYSSFNNTTGINNTTIGLYSSFNNTIGANNTVIGVNALYNNSNGSNNTVIGYRSGQLINSGIAATESNWSTYIGAETRSYEYNSVNEVVIGASAVGYGSNTVTLGNDLITKTILKGNIGIGTASPSTKLHVYATQSGAFRLEDGTQGNNYILTSDSNGVATWTPLSSIGISGASGSIPKFTGTSSLGNSRFYEIGTAGYYGSGSSYVSFLTGGNTWLTLNRSQSSMGFILGNPQSPTFQVGQIQSTNTIGLSVESAGYTSFNTGPTYLEKMRITSGGNVGIGLTAPSTTLHVYATQSGAFRLEDGTQGNNYILTSDSNGVATWTASIYATDSNVVHKTGNETITGVKTFGNIGFLTNVVVQNYNTNPGSSALESINGNAGIGIKSENTSSGIGIYSNSTSTGLNYVGANSGVITFSVNKTGDVYASSSVSIGTGTASNSRFSVSSSGGTLSLVVNEQGDSIFSGDTKISGKTFSNLPPGSINFGNKTSIYSPGDRQIVIGTDNLSGYNYNYGWKFTDYQITNLWGNPIEVQNTMGTIGNLWIGSSYTIAGYGSPASQKSTLFVKGTTSSIMRVVGTGATWSNSQSIFEINNSGAVSIGTSGASASLHIKGTSSVWDNNSLLVENSSNTQLLKVLNNGQIILGDNNFAALGPGGVQGVFIIGQGNANYGPNTSNPNLLTFIVGSTDPTFVSGIQGASANHGNVRSGIYFTNNASDIVFRTGPTTAPLPEIMRIGVAGNVNINSATAMSGSKLFIQSSTSSTTIGSNVMLDLYNGDTGTFDSISEIAFSQNGQPGASQPYNVGHRYALITGYAITGNNSVSIGGIKFSTRATTGVGLVTSLVIDQNGSVYNQSRGISNTIYGYQALLSATASLNNIAFGYQALYSNTANDNVAIGYTSLYSNTTGDANTAIGFQSLKLNTTGEANTAIGWNSLLSNTTGSYNTSIGLQSLVYNTTGTANTSIGYGSLFNNTTSISAISITNGGSGYTMSSTFSNVQLSYISGSTATTYPIVTIYVGAGGTVSTATLVTNGTGFKDATTVMGANLGTGVTFSVSVSTLNSGDNNVAVGYNSLYSNTTGDNNVALGYQSLYSNTTGWRNTAIGVESLYLNTTGYFNIAIGFQSLRANTTGIGNISLGEQTLLNNNANYNIALGAYAMSSNISGTNNIAIGPAALATATQSSNNIAIGYDALYLNTTGTQNTAIGLRSLYYNTTGYNNIALGYYTLNSNTTGNNNTAIGVESLYLNTTGVNNTALGYYAGHLISGTTSGATNSNNSVFIGYDTRPQADGQTNQIVIGYGATGNGSNSVTLGNNSITRTYLKGSVVIADGTQGNGYILTSDTNGIASWSSTVAVITTTSSITTNTLDNNGLSQINKCVIIDNGTYSISLTVDTTSGFTSTYLKHGTASISFVQGSGRTLIQVDGTLVLNGSVGSSATIISYGTTDYLRVNNA